MGEAKRRRAVGDSGQGRLEKLEAAAGKVGWALQRLATAASGQFGGDCYLHAVFGKSLLADLGIASQVEVGFAAWRVGPGDGDVLAHTKATVSFVPEGSQGFPYHAWLAADDCIIDFTTYQFERKARELDAADGGRTEVIWRPAVLVLPRRATRTYKQVAQAMDAGHAYYEARTELLPQLEAHYAPAEEDLAAARLLLANPDMQAFGPNQANSLSK